MKNVRQVCAALSLTILLSVYAFGGEIGCPGVSTEPPPAPTTTAGDVGSPSITATGDVSTPGAAALEPLSEFTLSLLRSVLFLF